LNGQARFDAKDLGLLALILGAAAWMHAAALRLPFFADDYLFLDQVRNRSLWATLASGDPLGNFFRPVGRQIHFWWLAHVSGESPLAFHLANLVAFLLIVALLYWITRRMAGRVAALVASGFVALHYAADVPIRWASGSQDLLAVAGALAALALYAEGATLAAGVALLAALLCKETVALTPLIAIAMTRRAGDSWRASVTRAWPLFAAIAAWAVMWLAAAPRLRGAERTIEFNPWGPVAALAHLAQVIPGVEWAAHGRPTWPGMPEWIPLGLVVIALTAGIAWRGAAPAPLDPAKSKPGRGRKHAVKPAPAGDVETPARGHALRSGLLWALLGAAPVAAVASIWSAYYYLFAICGVGLALGAALSRARPVVVVTIVALLAWSGQSGRNMMEFSQIPDLSNPHSHVNRFYLDRSMAYVDLYLEDMRAAHPTLPHGSTVFFSGVPSFAAWQSADGPVVRWAYRDSSLRSYYLADLNRDRLTRGPTFFFVAGPDTLTESARTVDLWRGTGISMLLDGRMEAALDAWAMGVREYPEDFPMRYWLGYLLVARNDSNGARLLGQLGVRLEPGPTPEIELALREVAAGDTAQAFRTCLDGVAGHGRDPGIHALLADVALSRLPTLPMGIFEAWLADQMVPDQPMNVQRWGVVLAKQARFRQAMPVFEHYLSLGSTEPETEAEVRRWMAEARRRLPGGDLAAAELRKMPGAR
jgi:hypothetical protein